MFQKDVLKGKRILVTGGGTGLGKEMAAEYASLGASVYICGRRQSVLDETVKEITDSGGQIKAYACDIRVSEAVNDMIDTIWKDGGALTGLVNNAAGNFISPTKDITPRGFEAISNIVFRGSFYFIVRKEKFSIFTVSYSSKYPRVLKKNSFSIGEKYKKDS